MLIFKMAYRTPTSARGGRFARLLGAALALCALLPAAALFPSTAVADSGPSLSVPVSTVRSGNGRVYVALYDGNNWLKPGRFVALRLVKARQGTVMATFNSVRPGRYSVAVFHDENNNGTVDRNLLGFPSEGFGFSRRSPMRIPSFGETSFDVAGSSTMPVLLRY
jgi:uncharacterized protein (DUF2141 family)